MPIEKDFELPPPDESHVTIWGTTQTGKTVYLAMLYHAFMQQNENNAWKLYPDREETLIWIRNIYSNMIQNGIFPPATNPGRHSFPRFSLQKGNRELKMVFVDASGEMFEDIEQYVRDYQIKHNPLRYLRACKGILFLLDPVRVIQDGDNSFLTPLTDTILKLLQNEQTGRPEIITKPMVFCMTKCDHPDLRHLLDDKHIQEHPNAIEEMATKLFGDGLMGAIRQYMSDAKWFASSSLGYEKNQPVNIMIRWDGRIGIIDPRKIRPQNVRESFEYLLNKIIE
jgi:hypothetical protein